MASGRVTFVAPFVLSFVICITHLSAYQSRHGFTLSLIPRGAPSVSPYSTLDDDDAGSSKFSQIQSAITRSIARANRFSDFGYGLNSASDPESDIIIASGEYIMNISIGTPPFPILAIADTGSDLTWTQCKPCSQCYDQEAPLFDSTKSSTYRPVSCSVSQCLSHSTGFNPSCESHKCQYSISYGDQSYTNGALASETLTLGSAKFRNILFGCGFDNEGTFSSAGSGIIGLGNGPDSLIGQINKTIGGKFSYCLVKLSAQNVKSSPINFGRNAIVSGRDVVSTPIVSKPPSTYFWLTLEAITINNVKVPFTVEGYYGGDANQKGNIVIDSGTTLLILPEDYYTSVETEMRKHVKGKEVEGVQGLTMCYDKETFKAPNSIVANFEGADVKLNDYNMFVEAAEGAVCFAAVSSGGMAIYGNLAQMDFLVGYDKAAGKVSFKPADCAMSG